MANFSPASCTPFPRSILIFFSLAFCFNLSRAEHITFKVVNTSNPVLHVHPLPHFEQSSAYSAKDIISCERIQVAGLSRLKVNRFSNSFRVTLEPSAVIPSRLHSKIAVCFHQNTSLGLCQCANDEWKAIQKGQWSSIMSPYEDRYVDVRFTDGASGSVTISLQEEFQQWRIICLGFGFVLLLLAPIVSHWVPFYYSSSMALGVVLVVLILLFQGMKLLPTGRKNLFYLTIYGSMIGLGSFLVHYFSMLVNSILVSFGLSEDMYNPVSVFVLVGIFLAGAALGYWIVRKFVLAEDGTVDVGTAYFVKWAMRVIAAVFFFQSTFDTLLAVFALSSSWIICSLITSKLLRSRRSMQLSHHVNRRLWQQRACQASANHKRAEFLSKSPKMGSVRGVLKNRRSPLLWSSSPSDGLNLSAPTRTTDDEQDYYSTFHKTPNRKRFSRREWDEFTDQSTRKALAEWASSPEFADWVVENADRINVASEVSSDGGTESGSETFEETAGESESGISLFKWY
ncbi:uncharacterized protein [Aristolochia californica]|uniref:uncharacterized protein n=1 Tax=Aristolochia californica TaxID=171875 RepID=UPI0035D52FF4